MKNTKTTKRVLALFLVVLTVLTMFSICATAANPIKLTAANCTYKEAQTYTGKAITPGVTVKYKNTTLKKNTDYTLAYANNKSIGTGSITVTGKGKYTGKVKLLFSINLGKPASLKASSITNKNAKLSWSKVTGASKYYVYKYDTSAKKYVKVATVNTNSATVAVVMAKATKFAVKAYSSKGTSALSSAISVTGKVATPTLSAKAGGTDNITLSWNKVSGVTGYRILGYNASTDKYSTVKTIKGNSTVSLNVTGLKPAVTYAYAIQAYVTVSGSNVYSAKSAVVYVCTAPTTVTNLKAKTISSKYVTLSWSKVTGATGYTVYKYDSSAKKYVSMGSTVATSSTITGLSPLKSYTFAVAATRTAGGKTATGSKVKLTVKTKEANALGDFQDLIRSKKFKIKYVVKESGATLNTTCSVNGSDVSNKIKGDLNIIDEGKKLTVSMNMDTYYFGSKKYGYSIVDVEDEGMKLFLRLAGYKFPGYKKLSEKEAKENAMDSDSQVVMFAPQIVQGMSVETGSATVNGSKCTTYSYYYKIDGNFYKITYYFKGDTLVQINSSGSVMQIKSYTADVKSSDTALPSGFPKGYYESDFMDELF